MPFQVKTPRGTHKRVKLTSCHLLFQVKIEVTDLQLLCVLVCSFIYFIVYTVHEGVSDILVQVRELSAGTANPYKRLHAWGQMSVNQPRTLAQKISCFRVGQTLLTEMYASC